MLPLHRKIIQQPWIRVFSQAFNNLQQQLVNRRQAVTNGYGVSDPAEFFAVVSEYFFAAPQVLKERSPAVCELLVLFYRQSPIERLRV